MSSNLALVKELTNGHFGPSIRLDICSIVICLQWFKIKTIHLHPPLVEKGKKLWVKFRKMESFNSLDGGKNT